jgi:hypothetical protein
VVGGVYHVYVWFEAQNSCLTPARLSHQARHSSTHHSVLRRHTPTQHLPAQGASAHSPTLQPVPLPPQAAYSGTGVPTHAAVAAVLLVGTGATAGLTGVTAGLAGVTAGLAVVTAGVTAGLAGVTAGLGDGLGDSGAALTGITGATGPTGVTTVILAGSAVVLEGGTSLTGLMGRAATLGRAATAGAGRGTRLLARATTGVFGPGSHCTGSKPCEVGLLRNHSSKHHHGAGHMVLQRPGNKTCSCPAV